MEQSCIERVKKFLEEHLKEEFTLNELADHTGYSAFHFAREFKNALGVSVMEYMRNQRIHAAAKDIADGKNICGAAMDYCFDTHAGFTKAFTAIYGCSPKDYAVYAKKQKTNKGVKLMETSKIVIRHICKDDVQDLWENVYSAMTPRQITEDKIIPAIENYKKGAGMELVAEVDGKVVMSLPMTKPAWIPLGFLWDNCFTLDGGDRDIIMGKLIDEMKRQAKEYMNVSTLISPQGKDSDSSKAMQTFGFLKVMESDGWEYLMLAL
jgi:AraC-like DNA-binding protein